MDHNGWDVSKWIKKVLDAKYSKANLNQLVSGLNYLHKIKQGKLLTFLQKYESMFDGILGSYNGPDYKIELKEGIKPYHAKPFSISRVHEETLKREVDRLVKIGVLIRINNSQWLHQPSLFRRKMVQYILYPILGN